MGFPCRAETRLDSFHMVSHQQEGLLPDICSGPQDKAPNLFCNSRFEISGHAVYLDHKRWAKSNPVVLRLEQASESPLLHPTPRISDSESLGRGGS